MIKTIEIKQTDRGYVVEFPHKPSDHAIKGFHQIGMSWRSAGQDDRVFWRIPTGKLDEAMDFINYWFNIKGTGGYVITIIDERIGDDGFIPTGAENGMGGIISDADPGL